MLIINLKFIDYDWISKDSSNSIKGFLAIVIVFHHLSQIVTTGYNFENFRYMGTYAVSIFFFLSGYGLLYQLINKKYYLNKFIVKRIGKIIIPIMIVNIVYLIYKISYNSINFNYEYIYNSFRKGTTLIANGWFLNIIVIVYILFYIIFKNITINKGIFCIIVILIAYIVLAIKLEYGFWWYNSILTFPLGLIYARYKKLLDKFILHNYNKLIIFIGILLFISHNYDKIINILKINNIYFVAFLANFDNIIFTIFFILIAFKIIFKNKLLNFIGQISFEIYMIHGLMIIILGRYYISSVKNDFIYVGVVTISSIILGFILRKIFSIIKI